MNYEHIEPTLEQKVEALKKASTQESKPPQLDELLLRLDEEVDRLLLPASTTKPLDRIIHLRDWVSKNGLNLRDHDLKRKIWEGRRRAAGTPAGLEPGMDIDAPEEVWIWENILMQADTNLVCSLPKVGKTTLIIAAISAWHYGATEYLGQKFVGECPPVLIAGTDMSRSRWMPLLSRFGLTTFDKQKRKWNFVPDGPIKYLWTMNEPIHLDDAGLGLIADQVSRWKGCIFLADSYAKLIAPLGLSEADAAFAGPIGDLQEVVAPHDATPVVIHHSGKNAGHGAVAASRGNTALPGAVSQIINLKWFKPEQRAQDKRIYLETQGRGEDLEILVLQEESRWKLEGDAAEVLNEQRLQEAEDKLSDRQIDALEEVKNASRLGASVTAKQVHQRLLDGGEKVSERQALRTLRQLEHKGLLRSSRKVTSKGDACHFDLAGKSVPTVPLSDVTDVSGHIGQIRHGFTRDTFSPKNRSDTSDTLDTLDIKQVTKVNPNSCRSEIKGQCQQCGASFKQSHRAGQKKKFCSDRCRQKAHFLRKKAASVTK